MKIETGRMIVMWGFPNQLIPIIGMITCIETNESDSIKKITIYDGIRHYDVRSYITCDSYSFDNNLVSLWSLTGLFVRLFIIVCMCLFFIIGIFP